MSREVIQNLLSNKELEDWCFLECPDLDFAKELEELHDYWVSVPGKAGLKLNWVATARNSLRKHQGWKDDRKRSPMAAIEALAHSAKNTGMPEDDQTTIFDDME